MFEYQQMEVRHGIREWDNISFDLSAYAGQNVKVRFAFGSDHSFSTTSDPLLTGFHVDNIVVEGALDCNPENDCNMSYGGNTWYIYHYVSMVVY